MKNKGYTLVEMMVVLAIIVLLTAIVLPRFAVSQKGQGLKGAATELTTALRAARRLAIMNREVRAVALDIYSIPAQFMIMKPIFKDSDVYWEKEGDAHAFTDENVAIVGVESALNWSAFDITRTDDINLDTAEDTWTTPPFDATNRIFNPQINPSDPVVVGGEYEGTPKPGQTNGYVNPVYPFIRFQPTGTADRAVIYLWNIEDDRQNIPMDVLALTLSNITKLGVPPGMMINGGGSDQSDFFWLPDPASPADAYYYTVVVNPITGNVTVYDYAYGEGSATWDRKKDG